MVAAMNETLIEVKMGECKGKRKEKEGREEGSKERL